MRLLHSNKNPLSKHSPRLESNHRNSLLLFFFLNHVLLHKTTAFLGRRHYSKRTQLQVSAEGGGRRADPRFKARQQPPQPQGREMGLSPLPSHCGVQGGGEGLPWLLDTEGTCVKNEADTAMHVGRHQGQGAARESRDAQF